MRTLKLYGTAAATANNVASVTIPSASKIKGVQVALQVDSITDNALVWLEVSRSSSREIAVNGAQQCIVSFCTANNFVTSGMAVNSVNVFLPCDVDVVQGQLIYLHCFISGTAVFVCECVIHYS